MTLLTHLTGELTVTADTRPAVVEESVAALINERIRPPQPVSAGQIHVRSLRLISDEVNSHGGRFPADEHERLCDLIVDSPVLIGHDRSRLPVARNFAARAHVAGDRRWVTVWFYWMRGPAGDRLAADIDGGVIKEGSIGFEFRLPRCSICGLDMRRCEHIPGEVYRLADGERTTAHYEYRDFVRILETSLVYRGATPGTRAGADSVFDRSLASFGSTRNRTPMNRPRGPELAVVLARQSSQPGVCTYRVARRNPGDVSVCDEFTIATDGIFDVGDLLLRSNGLWHRIGTHRNRGADALNRRRSAL
ncbi:MAG: hypothetical protein Kow0074_23610 [Candidatus Zixiibacteriota bacterium]